MKGIRHRALRARHRYRQHEDDRVLPLVNVVFLLLIFFMIAGQMQAADPFGVLPPESSSEGPADLRPFVIYVAADGRLALDGDAITEAGLLARLKGLGPPATDLEIRVKADAATEARLVVRVLAALRDAGFERARLITLKGSA